MKNPIVCIPNVSEAKNFKIVKKLARTIEDSDGAKLVDLNTDIDHNRSVFTILVETKNVIDVLSKFYNEASSQIDIREHRGEHPRIGVVDVMPLVSGGKFKSFKLQPLAKELAACVAHNLSIPVFLYQDSATNEQNKSLAKIRAGGLQKLAQRLKTQKIVADFGPQKLNLTFGATVIGVRGVLIAFNIKLDTQKISIAKMIAKAIRESSGGMPYVQAIGISLKSWGVCEVSCNLLNYKATTIYDVFVRVCSLAKQLGVPTIGSQIIGVPPRDVFARGNKSRLRLLETQKVLEDFI